MTRGEQFPCEPVSHETCHELLPWYVNESLDEREHRSVIAHLEHCARCRNELASLTELRRAVREQPDAITATPDTRVVLPTLTPETRRGGGRVLRWIVAGQAAAIVLLSITVFWQSRDEPDFVLRSEPAAVDIVDGPGFRVVFAKGATLSDVRGLLRALELEIVAGPTAVGAYTLHIAGTDAAAATAKLATLRASPLVRLAEPVGK